MGYRTRLALLGLPLVDVSTGRVVNGVYRRGIARGWIAIVNTSAFSCPESPGEASRSAAWLCRRSWLSFAGSDASRRPDRSMARASSGGAAWSGPA